MIQPVFITRHILLTSIGVILLTSILLSNIKAIFQRKTLSYLSVIFVLTTLVFSTLYNYFTYKSYTTKATKTYLSENNYLDTLFIATNQISSFNLQYTLQREGFYEPNILSVSYNFDVAYGQIKERIKENHDKACLFNYFTSWGRKEYQLVTKLMERNGRNEFYNLKYPYGVSLVCFKN